MARWNLYAYKKTCMFIQDVCSINMLKDLHSSWNLWGAQTIWAGSLNLGCVSVSLVVKPGSQWKSKICQNHSLILLLEFFFAAVWEKHDYMEKKSKYSSVKHFVQFMCYYQEDYGVSEINIQQFEYTLIAFVCVFH